MSMDRRSWLKAAGLAALGAGLGPACGASYRVSEAAREFAKVKVSWDRVLRTVVGLRPYRSSGFRVEKEKFGRKTVVHNYGHGGQGISLSWGTSHLAVEQALETTPTRYAVVGCGAVGLATARLLQRKGLEVTVYAKDLPPETTSDIAEAVWEASIPTGPEVSIDFRQQYEQAARLSHAYFQKMVGDYYGVRWMECYSEASEEERLDHSRENPLFDLFPNFRELDQKQHPFPSTDVLRWNTMLIEPPIYLKALVRDFQLAGGKIVVRDFADLEELLALSEDVILNCTGLGSRMLFNDEELTPIKGQLTVLLPQPEIDYMVDIVHHMVSRKDGILLAGTWEPGVSSLEPDQEAIERVMNTHMEFFAKMK